MPEEKILLTLSTDDEIVRLVESHTRQRKGPRYPKAALKFLTLVANGTSRMSAAKLSGVPYDSTHRWTKMPWYQEAIALIKAKLDEHLDNTYTNVINKANEVVLDRLENGDFQLMKDGSAVRKPVAAKDAAIIGSIGFDKRNLLRGKPTNINENQSTESRLNALQERFRKFAEATEIDDAEYEEIDEAAE